MWRSLKYSARIPDTGDGRSADRVCTRDNDPWPLREALLLVLGLIALLGDFLRLPRLQVTLHLAFGTMLLATTAYGLWMALAAPSETRGDEFYWRTRQQARRIYFLLYAMAAIRLCFFFVERFAGTCSPTCAAATPRSAQDFLVYVGFGALAVGLIRLFTVIALPCVKSETSS